MTEETEQDIAKRIHRISTQIENIKATQLNTEQLTAVIRSANAQVRHIGRQQNELNTDDFQKACEMIKDTAEKLDYWESRYKLVLDIMEEWDKDFIQLKADYERLSKADGKTNKDALANTQDECNSKQSTIKQLAEELSKTREICEQKACKVQELETRLNNTNEHECCGYSDQLIDYYRRELNRRAVKLNEREYEYTAVVRNLEKVNAECETWKRRYQELNKKFDKNAVKFTDAKLKADAIALSYDELSDKLQAVEQERDQYKEKYEVTKKLLDAETSAEHTGSDSYNELYKENQQLYAALDKKEEQIDGLFKEAKLLTETKTSLVNELLDLRFLIHRLRLQEENNNVDDTEETKS